MSYKPADFFLNVTEFFAILLPGSILAVVLIDPGIEFLKILSVELSGSAEKWVAFLIASYISGHLLHHLGGIILDRWIYDWLYVRNYKRRKGEEKLLIKTRDIIKKKLGKEAGMTSAFSWAGSYVRANNTAAFKELERLGADSKFFRSLSLVALVISVLFIFDRSNPAFMAGTFLFFIFSLWRFCDRRWENSRLTYEYFIILSLGKEPTA